MIQHKSTFIVDHYIDVQGISTLGIVTLYLNGLSGVLYVVEPWGEDHFRVYVKKGSESVLKTISDVLGGINSDRETDGSGVSEPG